LGGSNVLQLATTDRSSKVAADLANALARELVENWDPTIHAAYDSLLDDLTAKQDSLRADITLIDGRITALLQPTVTTIPGSEIAPLTAALAYRQDLAQQVAALEDQRSKVEADMAGRQLPRVVQRATEPAAANASGLAQTVVLTTVLGLLLATAIAGVSEAISPHVGGAAAQAELLGGPSLGEFRLGRASLPPAEVELLARRLSVAAAARDVTTVSVVVVGQRGRFGRLLVTDSVREAARQSGLNFVPLLDGPPKGRPGELALRDRRKLGLAGPEHRRQPAATERRDGHRARHVRAAALGAQPRGRGVGVTTRPARDPDHGGTR
jgi:hypothetical protein